MLRTEVKKPILAISLELYDDATKTANETLLRKQWFTEEPDTFGALVRGKRRLIVDEVDDTRVTPSTLSRRSDASTRQRPSACSSCTISSSRRRRAASRHRLHCGRARRRRGIAILGTRRRTGATSAHEALARQCSGERPLWQKPRRRLVPAPWRHSCSCACAVESDGQSVSQVMSLHKFYLNLCTLPSLSPSSSSGAPAASSAVDDPSAGGAAASRSPTPAPSSAGGGGRRDERLDGGGRAVGGRVVVVGGRVVGGARDEGVARAGTTRRCPGAAPTRRCIPCGRGGTAARAAPRPPRSRRGRSRTTRCRRTRRRRPRRRRPRRRRGAARVAPLLVAVADDGQRGDRARRGARRRSPRAAASRSRASCTTGKGRGRSRRRASPSRGST